MKIKYLTIENFRGIKKLEKLEIGKLNTFVGKNDSGKSIILKALDAFFNDNFNEKDYFKGKGDSEVTYVQVSFEVESEIDDLLLDKEKLLTIKKEFHIEKNKVKPKTFYLVNDFENEKYQDLWNMKETDLNKLIDALGMKSFRSGSGNTNMKRIELLNGMLTKENKKETLHELGGLLEKLDETYKILLPEYYLFDADKNLDVGSDFQTNFKPLISSCFEKHKPTTKNIEEDVNKELGKELEEIKNLMLKNVSGIKHIKPNLKCELKVSTLDINFNFEGEEYSVPISHKGTGFKRLLMVAYFEYLANKNEIKDKIFAVEEPETYLHPSAQEDLLNSILILSEKSQFFVTTHSPVFAGASNGKHAILVKKDPKGISQYYRAEDSIKEIILELGIKPEYNLLKNAKLLIFVEGKDDCLFLNIAANKLFNKNLKQDGIITVIGGGSSLKNSAELDLFKEISSGRTYSIMRDGDITQKDREELKQKCTADSSLYFELTKREIENYCCPDKIKEVYIKQIKEREGESSQNPRITEIMTSPIIIDDQIDVEQHLKDLKFNSFKGNASIKVFEKMTKTDWEAKDQDLSLRNFIKSAYSLIASPIVD